MRKDPLVQIQKFTIYNKSNQRMLFPNLVIPVGESRVTEDSSLFELRAVREAFFNKLIDIVPNPTLFFGGVSAVPEAVENGGGGGGGSGDGNIIRVFRNFDTQSLPRGSPVYSPATGQMLGALGNTEGRLVVGLIAAESDVVVGETGDVLVDGTLVATTAEWDAITDMVGGLVRGRKYCLDLTAPGKLRLQVNAVGSPAYLVVVGYALSATEFKLEVQPTIRLA